MMIPHQNIQYKDASYWNKRYEYEENYDWYKGYDDFKHLIPQYVKPNDRILMLGCGNSSLSEDMYSGGFKNIVNVDISQVVIDKMSNKNVDTRNMEWIQMDARRMDTFSNHTFDVVIEKGTLDAMLVGDKDPWNILNENKTILDDVLQEVSRILRPCGTFLSITFAQPHFRQPLYALEQYKWNTEYHTFGSSFHYYLYVMIKGQEVKYKPMAYGTNHQDNNNVPVPISDEEDCMLFNNIDVENL